MQANGGDWRVVDVQGGITGRGFRSKAEAVRHAKHMFSVTTGGDRRQRVQRYEGGSADDPGMWVTVERIDDMHENARRKGSGWQEFTAPPFEVGSQVKLTGTFLRSTGQIAGGEGSKVWTVMGYRQGRGGPDYTFVYVDEPVSDPEMYADLPPDERPKYRAINAHNLMPARGGKMKVRYFPNHESNARRDAEPDEQAATELLLYIDNESDLSLQGPSGQGREIVKNLMRKLKKGKYDHALAPKLMLYLVESGGKRYAKEYGGSEREWSRTFTPATRDVVAGALAEQFLAAAQNGEFDHIDLKPGAR